MAKSLLVFYDGYCPLCRGSKRAIEKADWLHQIAFLSFREPGIIEYYGLRDKQPEERICSIHLHDHQVYEGIHTIFQISLHVPLYWIFVPFLYLSIKAGLGQRAYDFIAQRRKIIPVGQCSEEGCPIHSHDQKNK
ncbi:MAG TPA: DUF393 domain-containing protein [Bacillales bacterium]|nr:DUF393 domain-containing protein [Bacillales bacterium]